MAFKNISFIPFLFWSRYDWLQERENTFFSSLNKKVKPSLTDTITFCHFFRLIFLLYKNIILSTSSAETFVHAPSCIGCVEMIKHTIYTHLTWSDVHRTHKTDASWKYIAPYFFRSKLRTYFFRLFEFSNFCYLNCRISTVLFHFRFSPDASPCPMSGSLFHDR